MFFFSSKNPNATAEDWYNRLCWFSNPRQLLKPLLSEERSFMEKAKILWAMPNVSAEKTTDMRWLESKLEDAGHTQLAQITRFHLYQQQPEGRLQRDCVIWCRDVIEADIKIRRIVQREIYLKEEVQALQKALTLTLSSEKKAVQKYILGTYEKELRDLNDQYLRHDKMTWMADVCGPTAALKRAFKAWREDPDWYLCEWLRQDCAGRGGCCGRDCGCCEKARDTHRGQNREHCTGACGCCICTCGDGKKCSVKDLAFKIDNPVEAHSIRYNLAYIWGLSYLDGFGLTGYFS